MFATSFSTPVWLNVLKEYYKSDVGFDFAATMLKNNTGSSHFQFKDGLLFHESKLFIQECNNIRELLLCEYHNSTIGGHSGIKATMKRLSAVFTWPKLKASVFDFIPKCQVCQQVKYPNHKPYGVLQPLPIPSTVWQDISMDFITHLPLSQGKSAISVIVDRYSKFAHFIALPPKYGAVSLATLFLQNVYKLHGFPKSIVSDGDSIFLSKFWQEMFKQVGTKLNFSTAYHPQSDGQTEW
ncbi:putative nucleotidyltransferase, Ribonuclease H [Helianthus annuus]|nr:putative nucleotidyltransferase, Ribonuclease H [Helianthus annuus]